MEMLVTLKEASDHLRRDTDDDDDDLILKIQAASDAVLDYLKTRRNLYVATYDSNGDVIRDSNGWPTPALDSSGEPIIKPKVKHAVLILVGYMYRDRSGNEGDAYQQGYLPKPVTALLYSLRDPTLR